MWSLLYTRYPLPTLDVTLPLWIRTAVLPLFGALVFMGLVVACINGSILKAKLIIPPTKEMMLAKTENMNST